MRDDFAVFILSNHRANNIKTLDIIQKCGYTGKWYIICDNEDEQVPLYENNFGKEHIIVFDKLKKNQKNVIHLIQ